MENGAIIRLGQGTRALRNAMAGCLAMVLAAAPIPALTTMPAGHPAEALAGFGADDLAWASPRLRAFLHDRFGISHLNEPLCAPAGRGLKIVDIICEDQGGDVPDRAGPPRLLIGFAGRDEANARIVGAVSSKPIASDLWHCRPTRAELFVCIPRTIDRAEEDRRFAAWTAWLPSTLDETARWMSNDRDMRYLQRKPQPYSKADWSMLHRKIFEGTAMTTVRIERLVAIGRICGSLSEADATVILRNAQGKLDADRANLDESDRDRAAAHLRALRTGALQSASLSDVTDPASCQRFAAPYGTLAKLLTWTDRPQEAAPGILASPRTIP